MKLKRLTPNGTIGVIAPAFRPNGQRLEKGIQYLTDLGYKIKRGESLKKEFGYFAGSDADRLSDLHTMFADDETDIIICARGGWGCLRLLDQIDYQLIANNPKAFIGYSDITTLQLAFWQKCQLPSITGPMVAIEMGAGIWPYTADHFWNLLNLEDKTFELSFRSNDVQIWNPGRAQGRLLGGCLSLVAHQLGTPYMPDFTHSILVLEDIDEEPYKIDRYLAQLRQAGVLETLSGVVLGNFIDCEDKNEQRNSYTVEQILKEYFGHRDYPVIFDFPYGHGMKKVSLPIGMKAVLDTGAHTLKIENPFF